uniref:RING-type domain-containing protein n=1 Tax=Panagrolaimus superbus TaxID=310955 RepID=A0A914Z6V4_9BILA
MPTTHMCIICLEIINSNFITLKTCGHVFHDGCLQHWLTMSKFCPLCRIKTKENQMLKLFFEETPMVDAPKLIKENHKLIAKLEEKDTVIETLKAEIDVLQKQLEELKTEKEEYEKNFQTEKRKLKRKKKAEELLNCTIELTDSPAPPKKKSKRIWT